LLFLYEHALERPLDQIEGVVQARKPKPLPDALVRKYPNADREWGWQWGSPASSQYADRGAGVQHRHHLHESVIQKAVRHSPATHLLEDGYNIRTVRELLRHKDVETTMIYTHVANGGGRRAHSPLDRLWKPMSIEGGGPCGPKPVYWLST
jgi:hypothetical protein